VIYLAQHFKIKHGIVINKSDLANKFCLKIENFAKNNNISIIGKIPYKRDFVKSTIEMKPVIEINPEYEEIFKKIIIFINKEVEK